MPTLTWARVGVKFVLDRDRSEMARLSEWIDERVTALGLRGRVAYAARLCLEEAILNVIEHGRQVPGQPREIAVALDRQADGVVAAIEDHGAPFDPLLVPTPQRPRSLDLAAKGGRGIMLMRRFASAINYERVGEANRLAFRFC